MDNYDRFEAWLDRRAEQPAEVIAGLHAGFVPVTMDNGGMDAVPLDRLAAGGYDEDRAIYGNAAFGAGIEGVEPRTVHLGIDIFAPAGTPVYAPWPGTFHSFQDNAAALDYGPTIILEHTLEPDLMVFSLFGHLSRESLQGLNDGDSVAKGQQIATLGDRDVNGGWLPHLHFQLILDIAGKRGDFPGVFKRSERELWKRICPNPAQWLGLA
ncbi:MULTISPECIES: peptidoglycan DD-metalloendopeptidase family protein [Asticcacaulis]|uniref:peptidoglycan DD-metalloendopeptidase family protein n=1 Tax=Asticcacaulis TaxID=76890 RepID=UPI001AE3E1BF|nr:MULTISPECIES: peptidoglycan DD-metalloendopeptidase family protein [Asticcacaulis]MBP2161522.1 murein DD-endopeptidase MepM/ murein hydrolase activator NlpD [Asticcacaulis solisilvae]MDR6802627.1 murein DD-endopeptidase MepM/ murein hydrolase activator NlpD [Asticcacaulis sp. BE141]